MTGLYVGMPLISILNIIDEIKIEDRFKNNILNFCKQELKCGDSKISNEIELSMLTAWLNNSDDIVMPELLSDKYQLREARVKKDKENTITYEEFVAQDGSYYLRRIIRDKNNIVLKVTLSHKTSLTANVMKEEGIEDYLTDRNNDGHADTRTLLARSQNEMKMLNDINLDGHPD